MKKKLAMSLAAVLTVCALGSCGTDPGKSDLSIQQTESTEDTKNQEEVAERINLADLKIEDYVTLGEYQNLSVVVAPVTVEDEDVDAQALSLYNSKVTKENGGITDRAVVTGDTVNIDYEGKKDGVAFSGGTAQGASLTIGSGQFIDGFEDGLVGVMPGQTVDLDLTFPENYDSEELAGAAVVFTVTVNYIQPVEIEDEVVAGFGSQDYQDKEQLKQYVRLKLEEDARQTYEQNVEAAVINALVDNCTYQELPGELVAQFEQTIKENIEMMAYYYYGIDGNTYTSIAYGMDLETYVAQGAEESTKQILAVQAVADKEGLTISEESLKERLEKLASDNGWSSVEELLAQYDKEELRESLMFQDVSEYLTGNAAVSAQ